jgi:hypothetical protein
MRIETGRVDTNLLQIQRYALNEILDGQPLTPERKELLEGLREFNEYVYDQIVPIENVPTTEKGAIR